jgi:hypothetical protein
MTTPIYFPISFNPFYNTKKEKIDKRAKLPIGWDKTSATKEGLTNKALLTGKASGISVIDFDNLDSYNKCLELIPELQSTYKVKTKNGFHLYFEYNESLKTTTDCFTLPGIDIRNDGGCAIAPPSSYTFENITYKYEEIEGDIVPIPNELLKLITQKGLKEQEQEEPFVYTPTIVITDLVQLVRMLSVRRATDYTDWRNVGFGLYNILGKDGLNLFIEFSQLSTKHFNYRESALGGVTG